LQDVLVSSPGIPDVQFVANRWLAVGEGDGNTHVTLLPSNGGGLKLVKYRVHVGLAGVVRGAEVM
jgi:hypothetical protein